MPESTRGQFLTICAVLFALLGVSNLLKPLQIGGAQTGFVFLGQRLSGMPNTIAGPIFGIFLLAYASAIWKMKRLAMPMAHAYATYVILNLILFSMRNEQPPGISYQIFGVVYAAIAIGISLGAAVQLTKRKAELT